MIQHYFLFKYSYIHIWNKYFDVQITMRDLSFCYLLKIFLCECAVYDVCICVYMFMCVTADMLRPWCMLVLVFHIFRDSASLLFVAMYARQLLLSYQGLTYFCLPSYHRVLGLQMPTAKAGFTWDPNTPCYAYEMNTPPTESSPWSLVFSQGNILLWKVFRFTDFEQYKYEKIFLDFIFNLIMGGHLYLHKGGQKCWIACSQSYRWLGVTYHECWEPNEQYVLLTIEALWNVHFNYFFLRREIVYYLFSKWHSFIFICIKMCDNV